MTQMNILNETTSLSHGRFLYSEYETLGPRIQRDLQLVFVHRGEMEVHVDNQNILVPEGRAILLLPGGREFFHFARHEPTEHGWCVAAAQRHDVLVEELDSIQRLGDFTPRMQILDRSAWELTGAGRSGAVQVSESLCRALFTEFLDHIGYWDSASKRMSPPVAKALEHILGHWSEPLDLDRLAGVSSVTPTHLVRLFREHMDTTPMRYVWTCRMKEAARLLEQTGLQVSEIAYRCGFANPFHFSRAFKKKYHESPSVYRNRIWGNEG